MPNNINKKIAGFLSVIMLLTFFYLSTFVTKEQVEILTIKLGVLGPVIICLVILATQIFAPFSGTIGMFIGFKLYGYEITMVLFYFTSMLSAIINFYISKKFGRAFVQKIIGQSNLEKIDELIIEDDTKILIATRIFGYYFFDFISYAFGLTNIKFQKYFIFTAIFTLIPIIIQTVLFKDLDFGNFYHIVFYYSTIFFLSTFLTVYFFKKFKSKQNRKEENK